MSIALRKPQEIEKLKVANVVVAKTLKYPPQGELEELPALTLFPINSLDGYKKFILQNNTKNLLY